MEWVPTFIGVSVGDSRMKLWILGLDSITRWSAAAKSSIHTLLLATVDGCLRSRAIIRFCKALETLAYLKNWNKHTTKHINYRMPSWFPCFLSTLIAFAVSLKPAMSLATLPKKFVSALSSTDACSLGSHGNRPRLGLGDHVLFETVFKRNSSGKPAKNAM